MPEGKVRPVDLQGQPIPGWDWGPADREWAWNHNGNTRVLWFGGYELVDELGVRHLEMNRLPTVIMHGDAVITTPQESPEVPTSWTLAEPNPKRPWTFKQRLGAILLMGVLFGAIHRLWHPQWWGVVVCAAVGFAVGWFVPFHPTS